MKKLFKLVPALLVAVTALTFASCDDKDEPVSPNRLPSLAKEFISSYYPDVEIITTFKEGNEYEVTLGNGHRIDFNKSGEWTDVDAPAGMTIPSGFYPEAIDTYVAGLTPATGINEISKERRGYDVELVNGMELVFNLNGSFTGFDR